MSDSQQVYEPIAPPNKAQQTRHRLDSLAGKTVGFIDNAKPNFSFLVDDIAELLIREHGVAEVVKRRKVSAAVPAPDRVMQDIVEQCDAVITGSGD